MAKLDVAPVATIYNLKELFDAVCAQIASYDKELKDVPEWAQHYPPAASRSGLRNIQDQLTKWQQEGFDYIAAERPFSDGNLTGRVEDLIISQFGEVAFPQRCDPCRVTPFFVGGPLKIKKDTIYNIL